MAGLAAASLAACGGQQQPAAPAPRAVASDTIPADELIGAVLDECHRPLRGRMDRVAATLHCPDGEQVQLYASLPDKLRAQRQRGSFLLVGGDVYRLDGRSGEVADGDRQWLLRMRRLLDAAALGPLHRATACRRLADGDFEVTTSDGGVWRLALQAGTLLPSLLADGEEEMRILEHRRTATTWVAALVETAALGRVRLQFDLGDVTWAASFFAPPAARPALAGTQHKVLAPGAVAEQRSPVPLVIDQQELGLVVVADPGDWERRAAAYAPLHAELERQGQVIAGFPLLWTEDGRAWLAAPFRRRAGGPAFAPPEHFRVRAIAAGRWLVVHPPDGDLAQRIAAGSELLRRAAAERGLQARGPWFTQPYLHLHEGEPAAAQLASPVVRLAVPVD